MSVEWQVAAAVDFLLDQSCGMIEHSSWLLTSAVWHPRFLSDCPWKSVSCLIPVINPFLLNLTWVGFADCNWTLADRKAVRKASSIPAKEATLARLSWTRDTEKKKMCLWWPTKSKWIVYEWKERRTSSMKCNRVFHMIDTCGISPFLLFSLSTYFAGFTFTGYWCVCPSTRLWAP